jgi:hypothetical protein
MLPVALVCPFLIARGNQKWTNQSNWQHREKAKGAIKNGQTRATGNIERKPKEQSKMEALVCPYLIAHLVFSL